MEVNLLNKDIGFVHADQDVEIKLETFPFTKYGVIDGKVIHIAQNAVADENLGLIYPAKIEMAKDHIMVRGKRRLIEFILSPLLRYKDESMRERCCFYGFDLTGSKFQLKILHLETGKVTESPYPALELIIFIP